MRYLIDSSALIDWLKGKPPAVSLFADLVQGGHTLAVNAIAVAEVYSGLGPDERDATDRFVSDLDYWDIDLETATLAGAYRYQFARQGRTLSLPDVIMAAHAIRNGATLVTGNVRDFPMLDVAIHRLVH